MVNPTDNIVIIPPKTTAGTVPINLAVNPLSNAPSSLDDPIKIEFTDATLPRTSFGVFDFESETTDGCYLKKKIISIAAVLIIICPIEVRDSPNGIFGSRTFHQASAQMPELLGRRQI